MKAITIIGLVLALLAVGTVEAAAQTPAQSLADLQPTLKVGQSVFVTDDKGSVIRGRVVSILGKQLEIDGARSYRLAGLFSGGLLGRALRGSNQRYVFTEDVVRRIENVDSAWMPGGLIGAAASVGFVAAAAELDCSRSPSECASGGGRSLTWILLGPVIPLGIWAGYYIDLLTKRIIYEQQPTPSRIVMAPWFEGDRKGVMAAIRF